MGKCKTSSKREDFTPCLFFLHCFFHINNFTVLKCLEHLCSRHQALFKQILKCKLQNTAEATVTYIHSSAYNKYTSAKQSLSLQTSTEKPLLLCHFCFCCTTQTVQCVCEKLFTHLAGLCWRRKDAAQQRDQQHGARTLPGALSKHHGSLRKQKFPSRIVDLS